MVMELANAFADDLIRGTYAITQSRTGSEQALKVDLEAFLGAPNAPCS